MEHYRRSSHTVYDLKYHLVWITKYRKPILKGEIAVRLRELIRERCKSKDVEILKGHISRDHVHIFVSVPPHISVSDLLKSVKGRSSRKMLMEFKTLSRQFWGRHLWARGYFAASSGNVTDEVIMQYIEQQWHEPHLGTGWSDPPTGRGDEDWTRAGRSAQSAPRVLEPRLQLVPDLALHACRQHSVMLGQEGSDRPWVMLHELSERP